MIVAKTNQQHTSTHTKTKQEKTQILPLCLKTKKRDNIRQKSLKQIHKQEIIYTLTTLKTNKHPSKNPPTKSIPLTNSIACIRSYNKA